MRCPKLACRSTRLRVQRTDHPHTEGEWPQRFAGVNGISRRRWCANCGGKFTTLELTEDELMAIIRRGSLTPALG